MYSVWEKGGLRAAFLRSAESVAWAFSDLGRPQRTLRSRRKKTGAVL